MKPARPYRVTATGDAFDAGNASLELVMTGARLLGGSGATTAVVREGSGAGTILAELACGAAGVDQFEIPTRFKGKVHVTLTGAGSPACIVYVP